MKKFISFIFLMSSLLYAYDFNQAYILLKSGEIKKALSILKPLAKNGDKLTQVTLGELYLDGIGVETDHKKAYEWFLIAANKGEASAQFNLAMMYDNGLIDGKINHKMAFYWYLKAAKMNFYEAQYIVSIKLLNGEGVDKNIERANYWQDRAEKNRGAKIALY